jgi:hypothetical protein
MPLCQILSSTYSLFFNQRTTAPQFNYTNIELTLYTLTYGEKSHRIKIEVIRDISSAACCNDLNTLLFPPNIRICENGNKCGRDRHRSGGALRCVFLLAEKGSELDSECKRRGFQLEECRK